LTKLRIYGKSKGEDTMPNEQHLNKIVLVIDTDDGFHRDLSNEMRTGLPGVGLIFEKTTPFALMDSEIVSFGAIVLGTNAGDQPTEIVANSELLGRRFPKTGLILFATGDLPTPTVGNWVVIPRGETGPLLIEIKRILESI
jgi:hypothetical protein